MTNRPCKLVPVIMAGGSGTRLWPLSRAAYPKQFLSLFGDKTMLQQSIERLVNLSIEEPITICNEEHRFLVAEQLREIDIQGQIILEPFGRDTAPAVALAALLKEKDDPLLLVLAADHVIQDRVSFEEAVAKAVPFAEEGKLVTFGVTPTDPNTGYGYIKCGDSCSDGFAVSAFMEKPDSVTAKSYLRQGGYLWNSGIFLFKASRYLEELKKFRPNIHKACTSSAEKMSNDLDFLRVNKEIFSKCPGESIDYAVMENTADAFVVPLDADWSDIGSWSSLWDVSEKDQNGNATEGDVILQESKNCYVKSDNRLVAVVGVNDLVIVDTKDALMVADKNSAQDVKSITRQLKCSERSEWDLNRQVYRPWGHYDSVEYGERFQVKRINVKPGAKLSVQMHHHRAEHWVVVSGTAMVTKADETFILSENESTYIPVGVIHALENPGKIALEIIEIQSGSYLGEDDIVRFADRYGRAPS